MLNWFYKESAEEAKDWYDNKVEKIINIQNNLLKLKDTTMNESYVNGESLIYVNNKIIYAKNDEIYYRDNPTSSENKIASTQKDHASPQNARNLLSDGETVFFSKLLGLSENTVESILTNEKYRGDALLQKQYIADFLQKTRKTNNGEIPQYYVEEHHEAIIPPSQFDFVQAELARREKGGRYSGVSIFSNKIKCGCCGGWYGPKVWHSKDKYRKVIYRCNRKYGKDTPPCSTPHLTEEQIKEMFLKTLNTLVDEKAETIENLQGLIDTVCRTDALVVEQESLEQELGIIAENLTNLIRENARVAQDQEEYAKKEEKLRTIYGEKHNRFQELEALIQEKNDTKEILTNFINSLRDLTGEQTEFREELWGGLVDHIRVDSEKSSTVVFRGGIEVTLE